MNNKDLKEKEPNSSRHFKYGLVAVIAVIAVAVVLVLYFTLSTSYVAKVGKEKVTTAELNFFLKQVKSSMLFEAGIESDTPEAEAFWNSKLEGEETSIDIAKKKALENVRDLKVQVIKAKEKGLKLEKDEIEQITKSLESVISQSSSRTEADDIFKNSFGVTLSEAKKIYQQIILARKLMEEEITSMNISDSDFETFYKENGDRFINTSMRTNGEEAVWARHILVAVPQEGATEADWDEAKEKAQTILEKIKNGEDFSELAKQSSEDPGSAQYGGDYVFGRDKMVPEFEQVAFEQLEPGEVSDLVKTDFGYHIIKLEEKIPEGQQVSLNCAKQYREFGKPLVSMEKYQNLLEEWKGEYNIEINTPVYNSVQ